MRVSRLVIATVLVVLAGVGAAAAQWTAMEAVESQLAHLGLRDWVRRVEVGEATWSGATGAGMTVGTVSLLLVPTPRVLVQEVTVDLTATARPARSAGAATPAQRPRLSVPVDLEGLTLRLGTEPLLGPLTGSVLPVLALTGPQSSLSRSPGGGLRASLKQPVSLGPLAGDAAVTMDCTTLQRCAVRAVVENAVFEHPLLAPGPLAPLTLKGEGSVSVVDRTAEGVLRMGAASVSLAVDADQQLRVEAESLPLAAVLEPFAAYVPEVQHAEVEGTLGGVARVDLNTQRLLQLEPTAEGLAARGVLPNADALARGSVTWRAPVEGGDWVLRTTGRGWPGWTPLSQAGLVPAAMVAAEDSAFWRHDGVHLPAVTQAITDSLADPSAPLRGGSTITQQLAKNLFCDPGDRTMARKLSELLYALELEAVLPKQRILELYLNIVELGPQVYGVGAAADAYFLKRPDRMTPAEAAFLASILPAPRAFYERALAGRLPQARMDFVLDNMANGGSLTAREAEVAKQTPPRIVPLVKP